jgi:hypothetical protein
MVRRPIGFNLYFQKFNFPVLTAPVFMVSSHGLRLDFATFEPKSLMVNDLKNLGV